ncbi:hypothetical protein KJ742_07755 [Patescibacteria group bacterium]|nr:hypothetical protein [Patescibacteria group bacterium]MBU1683806.1 hypothetical protein [Patescibacteria group bacterium]MBU1935071.1 hypothetical protein [Patescibacteria group bacterium]
MPSNSLKQDDSPDAVSIAPAEDSKQGELTALMLGTRHLTEDALSSLISDLPDKVKELLGTLQNTQGEDLMPSVLLSCSFIVAYIQDMVTDINEFNTSPEAQARLAEVKKLISPELLAGIQSTFAGIDDKAQEMIAKTVDPENGPAYLISIKDQPGSLRFEVEELLNLMVGVVSLKQSIVTSELGFKTDFSEIKHDHTFAVRNEIGGSEFDVRLHIQEIIEKRIAEALVNEPADQLAQMILLYTAGQLALMNTGLAAQIINAFRMDEKFAVLGNSDAEKIQRVISIYKQCIIAIRQMKKAQRLLK